MGNVRSREPSSTTMISFLGHVWSIADLIVSAIHSWALKAGIRMDTKGFIRSEIRGQRSELGTAVWFRVQAVCLSQVASQTAKHLRLAPAVHRNIVPAQMQSTRTEGTVRFDPVFQNPFCDRFQRHFQLRELVPKQEA